jgi:hypothetical protein
VITERFSAQLLTGEPARSAEEVTGRLLAVQGQDPRGVRLAVRARSAGLTAADVDRALTADRSLLITWLNRGTLHLVRNEDYWWLHPLVTPPLLTGNSRRLGQEGVSPAAADAGVAVIERSLAAEGPLIRSQLRDRIAAAGVRTCGQALAHLLMLACLRGIAVRGPMAAGEHAYALVRDWLGAPPAPVDRDVALAELAGRFLAGHGPATDREPILGEHLGAVTVNGLFRPFALVDGRVVATWKLPAGVVVLNRFVELPGEAERELAADAEDVRRFLGVT